MNSQGSAAPQITSAPAKRSGLACLQCRTAKNKCDGEPPLLVVELSSHIEHKANSSDNVLASDPCTRCKRLHLDCSWQPSHRTGRPRKKRKEDSQEPCADKTLGPEPGFFDFSEAELLSLLNTSPFDSSQAAISSSPCRSGLFIQHQDTNDESASALISPLDAQSKTIGHLSALRDRLTAHSPIPATPVYHSQHIVQAQQSDAGLLDSGKQLYFSSFGKAMPMLGSISEYQDLLLDLGDTPLASLLQHAVACLGYLLFQGTNSIAAMDLRNRAQQFSSTIVVDPSLVKTAGMSHTIAIIQALILIAYDEYGRHKFDGAASHLRAASHLAIRLGLHRLDESTSPLHQHLHNSCLSKSMSIEALAEMGRRTWWELYLCDIMLHVASSGKIVRTLGNETSIVHVPKDIGSSAGQAYDIRVRTTALIHACTRPIIRQDSPDLDRLGAIDTILSNLLTQAQTKWSSSATLLSSLNATSTMDRWTLETKMETLFTAMTMLHAARIHLHRQAWFPDLTMDFESCSFVLPTRPMQIQDKDGETLSEEQRQSSIAISTSRIIASADAILRLVRLDQRMSADSLMTGIQWPLANSSKPLTAHWPFFGCCNMIASFGYVVAVAASGPTQSNLPAYVDEIRLFGSTADALQAGSPDLQTLLNICESDLPFTTGQAATTTATDGETKVWKVRAALSNIGFAESVLAANASVWPIASVYQREVSRCRQAIDFGGPTGLDEHV